MMVASEIHWSVHMKVSTWKLVQSNTTPQTAATKMASSWINTISLKIKDNIYFETFYWFVQVSLFLCTPLCEYINRDIHSHVRYMGRNNQRRQSFSIVGLVHLAVQPLRSAARRDNGAWLDTTVGQGACIVLHSPCGSCATLSLRGGG